MWRKYDAEFGPNGSVTAIKTTSQRARTFRKREAKAAAARAKLTQDVIGTFAKSAARTLGGPTGQKLVRGLLGSLFGGR